MEPSWRAVVTSFPAAVRRERFFPSGLPALVVIVATALAFVLPTSTVLAQVAGGFVEKDDTTATRAVWTASQIQAFLPARGKFTFPAPYNTEGIRITTAGDCGGTDCVQSVGDASWRNINNHLGRDTMLTTLDSSAFSQQ